MPFGIAAGLIGAGLVGDLFSSSGAQQTNATNIQLAQLNNDFNAQQASLNRQFQADMSNTAEQRRVKDLEAAGLNPAAAMGFGGVGGGASTPGGSQASSAGLPHLQNPNEAFSNVGQLASSALQAASQTELNQANADLARSQTPTPDYRPKLNDQGELEVPSGGHELGDAQLAKIKADTGVSDAAAKQAMANVGLINAQVNNTNAQTAVANIQAGLSGQRLDVLIATKQAIIQQETAKGAEAKNIQNLLSSPTWGPIISVIDRLIRPATSAMGAVMP